MHIYRGGSWGTGHFLALPMAVTGVLLYQGIALPLTDVSQTQELALMRSLFVKSCRACPAWPLKPQRGTCRPQNRMLSDASPPVTPTQAAGLSACRAAGSRSSPCTSDLGQMLIFTVLSRNDMAGQQVATAVRSWP